MKIILSSDLQTHIDWVQDWLDFNLIDYQCRPFWNQDTNEYVLDMNIEHSIVVLSQTMFMNFVEAQSSINCLKKFLEQNNQLWIIGTDIAVNCVSHKYYKIIQNLDLDISSSKILLFLDATPTDRCYLSKFQNIKICVLPVNLFNKMSPRLQSNSYTKLNPKYDYLLTMIKKVGRPHRQILWNQLVQRPGLLAHGLTACHADLVQEWAGQQPHQHSWKDGHASMDLYKNCWIEIVPETMYKDIYFFTEKTQKPIMTQTPFLVVSTAGYLTWLKSNGYQTFHSLIDESYDLHYCVEDRVACMINVLEDIIVNGADKFYEASKPILEHNFYRLCEIAGAWRYEIDNALWQALDRARKLFTSS